LLSLPLIDDGDSIRLGAVVEADGAAGATLSAVLGRNEALAVRCGSGTEDLTGAGGNASPASFAFVGSDLRKSGKKNGQLRSWSFAKLREDT